MPTPNFPDFNDDRRRDASTALTMAGLWLAPSAEATRFRSNRWTGRNLMPTLAEPGGQPPVASGFVHLSLGNRVKSRSVVQTVAPCSSAIAAIRNANRFMAGRVSRHAILNSNLIPDLPVDYSAVEQEDDPFGKPAEGRVMGHEHQTRALLRESTHGGAHFVSRTEVQARHGLVEDQRPRAMNQGAAEQQAARVTR